MRTNLSWAQEQRRALIRNLTPEYYNYITKIWKRFLKDAKYLHIFPSAVCQSRDTIKQLLRTKKAAHNLKCPDFTCICHGVISGNIKTEMSLRLMCSWPHTFPVRAIRCANKSRAALLFAFHKQQVARTNLTATWKNYMENICLMFFRLFGHITALL